jgi:hypothetical protein
LIDLVCHIDRRRPKPTDNPCATASI